MDLFPWKKNKPPKKQGKRRLGKYAVLSSWVYKALVTFAKTEGMLYRDIADEVMILGIVVKFRANNAMYFLNLSENSLE
ncbi:hypothetical protein ACFLX3_01785 [Chloroflexota bacterium]